MRHRNGVSKLRPLSPDNGVRQHSFWAAAQQLENRENRSDHSAKGKTESELRVIVSDCHLKAKHHNFYNKLNLSF